MFKKLTIITSCLLTTIPCLASSDVNFGFDLDGKYQQQNYTTGNNKTYRLNLQPWGIFGNWLLYADLPFEARESTTTSNQIIYARTSTGRIIRRIPAQTLNISKTQQHEGMADASLGISYGIFQHNWQHNIALDYKLDNGDISQGLGSDTLETSLSLSTNYSFDTLSVNGQLGYLWVGGNNPNQSKNYSFLSTGINWQALPNCKASLYYNNQTEPYDQAPEQAYLQSRVDWRVNDALKVYTSYSQYLQQHISLPESEFSIGLKFLF